MTAFIGKSMRYANQPFLVRNAVKKQVKPVSYLCTHTMLKSQILNCKSVKPVECWTRNKENRVKILTHSQNPYEVG